MPNYAEGKIYAIRSRMNEDLVYIGSTCEPLHKRLYGHRKGYQAYQKDLKRYVSSYEVLEAGDEYIELVENYPCKSKYELQKREGEVIRREGDKCVNQVYYYKELQFRLKKKPTVMDHFKHNDNELYKTILKLRKSLSSIRLSNKIFNSIPGCAFSTSDEKSLDEQLMLLKVTVRGLQKKQSRFEKYVEDHKDDEVAKTRDEEELKKIKISIEIQTDKYNKLKATIDKIRSRKVDKIVLERKPKQTAEDVKKRRAELIECAVCGSVYRRSNKSKHEKTERHTSHM